MIIIIDTSIFLNILQVHNFSQDNEKVLQNFKEYIELNATFILPMATILETGNHIAQNGNGDQRRATAQKFSKQVLESLKGNAPWTVSQFPDNENIKDWINDFPDCAGKNKSPKKPEGTGFGDLTIIQEFNKQCKINSGHEIMIWSLDKDLNKYHHQFNS